MYISLSNEYAVQLNIVNFHVENYIKKTTWEVLHEI